MTPEAIGLAFLPSVNAITPTQIAAALVNLPAADRAYLKAHFAPLQLRIWLALGLKPREQIALHRNPKNPIP